MYFSISSNFFWCGIIWDDWWDMPFVLVNAERDARALEVKSVRGDFLGVGSGCRSEFVRIAMITQLLKWRESPWDTQLSDDMVRRSMGDIQL